MAKKTVTDRPLTDAERAALEQAWPQIAAGLQTAAPHLVIRGMLAFAAQPPDSYTGEAEKCFHPALHGGLGWASRDPDEDQEAGRIEYDGQAHYAELRRRVLRMLRRIAKEPKRPGRQTAQWIDNALRQDVMPEVRFRDGHLRYGWRVHSVEAGCALGLALLYETGQAHRLATCTECGGFFVDEPGRRGRRQLYCSEPCRHEGELDRAAERQRRYRERLKRNKRRTK